MSLFSSRYRGTQNDPEMATAIQAGTARFKEAFMRQQSRMRESAMEKERQIQVSWPSGQSAFMAGWYIGVD